MVTYEQKIIEPIKRLNKFSSIFKQKTFMNFTEFSFLLFCLSTFNEFIKLYLINLGKETKNKILNNLFSFEDSLTIVINAH